MTLITTWLEAGWIDEYIIWQSSCEDSMIDSHDTGLYLLGHRVDTVYGYMAQQDKAVQD